MKMLSSLLACIFGYMMLALSIVVTVETIGCKLFDFSLQGADELGGYALAVGSSIGFSAALIERAHIRVDLFHGLLPRPLRILLNWLSSLLIACLALMLVWVCVTVLSDTIAYDSVAPSPWATPLIYPQSIWLACLVIFALLAAGFATRATLLLLQGRFSELDRRYGPRQIEEEVQSELSDVRPEQIAQTAREATS